MATSSGSPRRRAGAPKSIRRRSWGRQDWALTISVAMPAGQMQLTRTPLGPYSTAIERVMATVAPGRRIGVAAGHTHHAGAGTRVDDRAAAALDHERNAVAAAEIDAVQVDCQNLVPDRSSRSVTRPSGCSETPRRCCTAHGARRSTPRPCHKGLRGAVRHIRADERSIAARAPQLRLGLAAQCLVDLGQDDPGALAHKSPGASQPDAAPSAGDDSNLARQSHFNLLPLRYTLAPATGWRRYSLIRTASFGATRPY